MKRPTIKDLAEASGVSIATVNRILSGSENVRSGNLDRVHQAAAEIGFYGLGTIQVRVEESRPRYRFALILHQEYREFYRLMTIAFRNYARELTDCVVEIVPYYMNDLSPQAIADQLLKAGENADALGIVSAVQPVVVQAVETLRERGVPVFALVSQLSSTGQTNYIGLDNWKLGRTAAWAIDHLCKKPGKVAIFVGSHRYRCQDMNESGFRSYFRENELDRQILEPIITHETSAIAEVETRKLLEEEPELAGIFVAGGGVSGVIQAMRQSGRANEITFVGQELITNTKDALIDGTIDFLIAHPLDQLARSATNNMIEACKNRNGAQNLTSIVQFDIFTRENI